MDLKGRKGVGSRLRSCARLNSATACLLVGGLLLAGLSLHIGDAAAASSSLSGNNACRISSGTMSFSPALRTDGNSQASDVTVQLKLSSCSNSNATGGTFSGAPSYALPNDSCSSLGSNGSAGGNILWTPRKTNTHSTDVYFGARSESLGSVVSFKFANGTASGGSFDGSAKATLNLKETESQITSDCGSSSGLSQLIVADGQFKVGPKY